MKKHMISFTAIYALMHTAYSFTLFDYHIGWSLLIRSFIVAFSVVAIVFLSDKLKKNKKKV